MAREGYMGLVSENERFVRYIDMPVILLSSWIMRSLSYAQGSLVDLMTALFAVSFFSYWHE